ncbi:hypothetical protein Tco_0439668 [Tanacetum coccineum]
MIIKKDSEIVKAKVERKSLALKAKKESSDEVGGESFSLLVVKKKSMPWRHRRQETKEHFVGVLGAIAVKRNKKRSRQDISCTQAPK